MTDLREIDRKIAVEVMGYTLKREDCNSYWVDQDGFEPDHGSNYSSEISDAWKVVEKIQSECALERWPEFKSTWRCTFNRSQEWAKADTAPLAICLAALQTKERK